MVRLLRLETRCLTRNPVVFLLLIAVLPIGSYAEKTVYEWSQRGQTLRKTGFTAKCQKGDPPKFKLDDKSNHPQGAVVWLDLNDDEKADLGVKHGFFTVQGGFLIPATNRESPSFTGQDVFLNVFRRNEFAWKIRGTVRADGKFAFFFASADPELTNIQMQPNFRIGTLFQDLRIEQSTDVVELVKDESNADALVFKCSRQKGITIPRPSPAQQRKSRNLLANPLVRASNINLLLLATGSGTHDDKVTRLGKLGDKLTLNNVTRTATKEVTETKVLIVFDPALLENEIYTFKFENRQIAFLYLENPKGLSNQKTTTIDMKHLDGKWKFEVPEFQLGRSILQVFDFSPQGAAGIGAYICSYELMRLEDEENTKYCLTMPNVMDESFWKSKILIHYEFGCSGDHMGYIGENSFVKLKNPLYLSPIGEYGECSRTVAPVLVSPKENLLSVATSNYWTFVESLATGRSYPQENRYMVHYCSHHTKFVAFVKAIAVTEKKTEFEITNDLLPMKQLEDGKKYLLVFGVMYNHPIFAGFEIVEPLKSSDGCYQIPIELQQSWNAEAQENFGFMVADKAELLLYQETPENLHMFYVYEDPAGVSCIFKPKYIVV